MEKKSYVKVNLTAIFFQKLVFGLKTCFLILFQFEVDKRKFATLSAPVWFLIFSYVRSTEQHTYTTNQYSSKQIYLIKDCRAIGKGRQLILPSQLFKSETILFFFYDKRFKSSVLKRVFFAVFLHMF